MKLFPKEYLPSVSHIDLKKLWNEGKRGIISDIDNTLCKDEQFYIEEASKKFIEEALNIGFKICLMSNNGEARVKPVATELNLPYHFKAHKPKSEAYNTCLKKMGLTVEEGVMVGDQLFTDIYGANRIGLYSVLVEKIHPKEIIQIRLKRPFEKLVLFFFKK